MTSSPLERIRNISREEQKYDARRAMWRRTLVAAMREAYGPHTLQQIGEAAGLSRQRVQQIIKEEK